MEFEIRIIMGYTRRYDSISEALALRDITKCLYIDLSLQDLSINSNSSSMYLRCERLYRIEALFGQNRLFEINQLSCIS